MGADSKIFDAISKAMNSGGSAVLSAFDAGVSAFNTTMSALSSDESATLRNRIKALEKNIQALYVDIAKEASNHPDPAVAFESKAVAANLGAIRELGNEIGLIKQRIAEIEGSKPDKSQPVEGKQQPVEKKQQPTEKKPQPESVGVTKFFIHAISDSISRGLKIEKSAPERKTAGQEKSGGKSEVSSNSGQQSDATHEEQATHEERVTHEEKVTAVHEGPESAETADMSVLEDRPEPHVANEFASVRTRIHSAQFTPVSAYTFAVPPAHKPEPLVPDESEPVFRTRAHKI